jgi:hypothetical protein
VTAPGPARLREADLFALAGAGLLEAARDYVLLGRVRRPRRRGARVAAEVEGSDATYVCSADVEALPDAAPRLLPACDCPSQRPYCKHVLALLHLWATDPDAFACLDDAEARLRTRPAGTLAGLLCGAAMGEGDPLDIALAAAAPLDWATLPSGRCLEAWQDFRADAVRAARWPEAAFSLGLRIAGRPGDQPRRRGADAAVDLRQLCWWLTLVGGDLPDAAVRPWLGQLVAHLESARLAGDAASLPPELGVWLARLAEALPDAFAADRLWLARFAAAVPTLRPVFEAQTQLLLWTEEVAARVAVAPAVPEEVAVRCRQTLAAMATTLAADQR